MKDTYIVKMKWDSRKRPQQMIVRFLPSWWETSSRGRKIMLKELRYSIKMFVNEAKSNVPR